MLLHSNPNRFTDCYNINLTQEFEGSQSPKGRFSGRVDVNIFSPEPSEPEYPLANGFQSSAPTQADANVIRF